MLAATAITGFITILIILIHYETIWRLQKWEVGKRKNVRLTIITTVFMLFISHSLQIWLFAGGLYFAKNIVGLGSLTGAFSETARDYLYISVVTYTTLGYGDIQPTGFLRTICGFEALIGLLMMAWSAAFTVYRMQELWLDDKNS